MRSVTGLPGPGQLGVAEVHASSEPRCGFSSHSHRAEVHVPRRARDAPPPGRPATRVGRGRSTVGAYTRCRGGGGAAATVTCDLRAAAGGAAARAAHGHPPVPRCTRVTTFPPLCHLSISHVHTCASLTSVLLCALSSECLTGPTTESLVQACPQVNAEWSQGVSHITPSYRLTSLAGRLSSRCPGPRPQTRATAWPHPAARGTREWRGCGPGSGRVRPTRR